MDANDGCSPGNLNFKHMTFIHEEFHISAWMWSFYVQRHCLGFFQIHICFVFDFRMKTCLDILDFFSLFFQTHDLLCQLWPSHQFAIGNKPSASLAYSHVDIIPIIWPSHAFNCTPQLCHIFVSCLKTVFEIVLLCAFVPMLPPSARFCVFILQQQTWAHCSYRFGLFIFKHFPPLHAAQGNHSKRGFFVQKWIAQSVSALSGECRNQCSFGLSNNTAATQVFTLQHQRDVSLLIFATARKKSQAKPKGKWSL